ncbi:MAG: pilus assembly protein PilB [Stygiobacter sp. RIFOXYC12_FULL_38_8]|nr:MAG: Type IV pilus assembly protein PilB [Stygiobacter sp.]KAF0215499.1 MAG: Type IV pilus assembly protein [Ignavibacteria bacterium]OGU64684.1 MAG: pilus assembly protein PilB [Stygiobacter sp. GWC2_38_9]OGU84252.1 MAG: pilus assembly protein PilB [Stygiobacter sp. RIFOXYA12_FULL_38_9]OGV05922.1 MAG: pilus assembly protein PilB [Stygiobacter sp. RIFOXYB2_FULL_37_11]OGV10666.1 MAG: pilus assembly protein PilB [Stygiobacter sp. RIFOXYA2_FULL_38_8]OGV14513.1 MAG: pilus assembly protein PilB
MLEAQLEMTDKIGYLLLKKGIIDHKILEQALKIKEADQAKLKRNLAQILVDEFKFDHDIIFREVAVLYAFKELNFPIEELPEERITEMKNMMTKQGEEIKKLLLDHRVIPFKFDDKIRDKLILAAVDPTDRALAKIAYALNAKKFEINYLRKKDFDKLVGLLVSTENEFLKMMQESHEEMHVAEDESSVNEEELDAEINKSALINLIEASLIEGTRRGVSDIHLIPKSGNKTEIHFRLDGKLALWHTQENTLPEAVMAVVKDRSKGMDRFEREKAQDGFIQREIDGHIIRFRVSVLPTVGTELKNKFESIVIRILDDRKVIKDLSKLGLVGYSNQAFVKAISAPQGMIILTGPTGSGKSTTLIAALYQVINPTKNVLTVEDPVEYVIEGARQLKIGYKMNFEQAIRAILRHDPDIVLVGEMRDKETAETAIKLANTGHLTFSTLHTNDAPSAVARLYKMGVEPFLIAYAINIIVAQRLIRKLCESCKKKVTNVEEYVRLAGMDPKDWIGAELYEEVGCDKCNHSGYKGRMAIHEALYFTKEIRRLIVHSGEDVDEEAIREQARKDGTLSLRDAGFQKAKLGLTSIPEVIGATMED